MNPIFHNIMKVFSRRGTTPVSIQTMSLGTKRHTVLYRKNFGGTGLSDLEITKIQPYVSSKYFGFKPRKTSQIIIEDKKLGILNIKLGKGADKTVALGILESGKHMQEVAILIYKVSSKLGCIFSPVRAQEKMKIIMDEIRKTMELLKPVDKNPYLDLNYLVSPEIVGNEIIIAKSLAISDLFNGLTGDMTCLKLLHIIRDATRGIDAMHKENLVHSDIKPQNILIKQVDSPIGVQGVVTDFDGAGKEGSVVSRSTPFYQPDPMPKDESGKPIIMASSDVFSIGRILIDAFSDNIQKWCDKNRKDQSDFIDEIRDIGSRIVQNGMTAEQVIQELDTLINEAENLDFPKLGKKNLKKNFEPMNLNW